MPGTKFRLGTIAWVLTMVIGSVGCQAPLDARESGTETMVLATERIPIDNCGGLAEVTIHREISKTFYHEVYVDTEAEIGLDTLIVASALRQRHGYQDGQAETRSFGIDLTAPPSWKVIYVLQWEEVWTKGILYDPGTGKTQGTYRVRKDIQPHIIDSYAEACP